MYTRLEVCISYAHLYYMLLVSRYGYHLRDRNVAGNKESHVADAPDAPRSDRLDDLIECRSRQSPLFPTFINYCILCVMTTPRPQEEESLKDIPVKVTVAGTLFNLPTADVVFLTADDVEFYLHKNILSIASPFFNDMFSLMQPSKGTIQDVEADDRIPITENSNTFDALLRLVYPVTESSLTDRVEVEYMLEAALKYQLEKAVGSLRRAWRLFILQSPLSIFAGACRLRLQEEAAMAAEEWKRKAMWKKDREVFEFGSTMEGASYTEDMANVSAGTYFRLLYFLRCDPSPTVNFVDPSDPAAQNQNPSEPLKIVSDDEQGTFFPNPNIALRSDSGVDVLTHDFVIRAASAEALLAGLSSAPSSSPNIPVYDVQADADTLRALLRLCYPFAPIRVDPVPIFVNLMQYCN